MTQEQEQEARIKELESIIEEAIDLCLMPTPRLMPLEVLAVLGKATKTRKTTNTK